MEYKHFSHKHTLNLYKVQEGQQHHCHGCQSMCDDSVYGCWNCNFFLHEHCGNANRYIRHPAHPLHLLILLPTPTYCSGSFFCDACGAAGSAFSYCCPPCEVDLHLSCAFLPPEVVHKAHHQHELVLVYTMPDNKGSPEYCKICTKELSSKNWSYVCESPECDFRLHTFCATTEVKPGIYQDIEPVSESLRTSTAGNGISNNQNACQPANDVNEMEELFRREQEFALALQNERLRVHTVTSIIANMV